MKIIFLDDGKPADIKIEEFKSYKVVVIKNRYYIWPADYYGWKHVTVADKFTNGTFEKLRAAGSFRTRSDDRMVIEDYYSMSLNSAGYRVHMDHEHFENLASMLNLTIEDEY